MNLLVIGGGSKLATRFLSQLDKDRYTLYITYHATKREENDYTFSVDLQNEFSLHNFTERVSEIRFDKVLFFSSTYSSDDNAKDLFTQYQNDFLCNALSFAYICKNIHFNALSQVLVFGDSGLTHPKKNFSSYSFSKLAFENMVKILAVELAPTTKVNAIRLGPTLKQDTSDDSYYQKYLLEPNKDEPANGIVSLINFILDNASLNMTGSLIDYDGGAYMLRPR